MAAVTIIYTLDVRCDHRTDSDVRCNYWEHGVVRVGIAPTTAHARAGLAGNTDWRHKHGPSRCGYDLCPEHATEIPGGTFPDWKAT